MRHGSSEGLPAAHCAKTFPDRLATQAIRDEKVEWKRRPSGLSRRSNFGWCEFRRDCDALRACRTLGFREPRAVGASTMAAFLAPRWSDSLPWYSSGPRSSHPVAPVQSPQMAELLVRYWFWFLRSDWMLSLLLWCAFEWRNRRRVQDRSRHSTPPEVGWLPPTAHQFVDRPIRIAYSLAKEWSFYIDIAAYRLRPWTYWANPKVYI